MRYLLCFIPPLAVLSCGKVVQFPLSCLLTLLLYVPGVIHAILVVGQFNADKRTDRIINALAVPGSGPPPLPQTSGQGTSMKRILIVGTCACFFGFLILASLIAGLQSKFPTETGESASATQIEPTATPKHEKAASNEEPLPASPAAPALTPPKVETTLPSYAIISDESNRAKKWRVVSVRLQEKVSTDDLRRISENVKAIKPNKSSTKIFYLLPEQMVGAGAWAIANFDPKLEIEIVGTPKGTLPPKPDGEIIGQWEYATAGMYLTLTRTKSGLKMISTRGEDNKTIFDDLVAAKVDGNRVVIRPTKAFEQGDSYWILDEAKSLLLADETGVYGKAAALIKPTLKP